MERVTFEGRDDLNEGEMQMAGWDGTGTTPSWAGGWKTLHGRMPGPRGTRAAGAKNRSGRWGQGPLPGWVHRQHTPSQARGPNLETTNETRPPPQQGSIASHRTQRRRFLNLFSNSLHSHGWDGRVLNIEIQSANLFLLDSSLSRLPASLPLPLPRDGIWGVHRWHDPWSVTALLLRCSPVSSLLITVSLAAWPVRLCLGRIA